MLKNVTTLAEVLDIGEKEFSKAISGKSKKELARLQKILSQGKTKLAKSFNRLIEAEMVGAEASAKPAAAKKVSKPKAVVNVKQPIKAKEKPVTIVKAATPSNGTAKKAEEDDSGFPNSIPFDTAEGKKEYTRVKEVSTKVLRELINTHPLRIVVLMDEGYKVPTMCLLSYINDLKGEDDTMHMVDRSRKLNSTLEGTLSKDGSEFQQGKTTFPVGFYIEK